MNKMKNALKMLQAFQTSCPHQAAFVSAKLETADKGPRIVLTYNTGSITKDSALHLILGTADDAGIADVEDPRGVVVRYHFVTL